MAALVQSCFQAYPKQVQTRLVELRELILTVAAELNLGQVEESMKWGQLSFSVKTGSPFRIDWNAKSPEHYYLFFHCQTKLVDTFRQLYDKELEFQGNRAIVLPLSEPLPKQAISHCLSLAFTYRQRKHLPLLGA